MKNKKTLIVLVLFVLIIFILNISNKNNDTYTLKVDNKKFSIREENKDGNYYIEINKKFSFRIYNKINKKSKLIDNIYYYKDKKYECVLPVIDNKIYNDMTCYKDKVLYNYNDIKGEDLSLDKYVNGIDIYDINKYKDLTNYKTIGTNKLNTNMKKNIISITTYDGLIINNEHLKLFNKDIYENNLSTYIDNYYIIADYNKKYEFNEFYIINLNNKKITKLKSKDSISFDSYIQGIVNHKIYLYDKDNEVQYEIDIENNYINIVSSEKYIQYYKNNKWEKLTKLKANKEVYFDYETLDNNFSKYDIVKETDNYFYLFKKDGISYNLYRVDKENIDIKKYILTLSTTNITYNEDYLYFVYKNKLYYYSDKLGLKTVLQNSELEFNDTIKYYIY